MICVDKRRCHRQAPRVNDERRKEHFPIQLIKEIMSVWLRRLAWLGLSCTSFAMQAANLDWLYDVEFSVSDQSEQERLVALQDGLEIVLIRITGLRKLPDSPLIDEAFNNLDAYQLQFRYEQERARDDEDVGMRLIINYDENAVRALIRDAELPVWSSQRPRVLFLISIVDGRHRTVLNEADRSELQSIIRATALRRGVAYSQPLMDFADRTILREGAIAFNFVTSAAPLKRRVQADVVSVVRVDPLVFNQHRVWLSIHDATGQRTQVFDSGDLKTTVVEIVDRTADYLATRYAVTAGEASALHLAVTGITDIVQYKAVLDYLSKWEFIDRVLLSAVVHDRIEFELRTASTWEQLSIYFDEDGFLIRHPVASQSSDRIAEFEWQDPK